MPLTSHYFYPFRASPSVKSRRSCCKSLNTTQHDDIIMQLGHARPSESPRPTLPLNAIFISFFCNERSCSAKCFHRRANYVNSRRAARSCSSAQTLVFYFFDRAINIRDWRCFAATRRFSRTEHSAHGAVNDDYLNTHDERASHSDKIGHGERCDPQLTRIVD